MVLCMPYSFCRWRTLSNHTATYHSRTRVTLYHIAGPPCYTDPILLEHSSSYSFPTTFKLRVLHFHTGYIFFLFSLFASNSAMAKEIGIGAAGETAGGVAAEIINKGFVAPIMKQIDDLIHMDRNNRFLQDKLLRMKNLLEDISNDFENEQRVPAKSITFCLERMRDAIQEARCLSVRSEQEQKGPLWLFYKVSISTQITELNAKFDQLFHDLLTDFGIFQSTRQIVSAAPPRKKDVLLQPIPEWGFIGSRIESAETELQAWINAEAPQVRVISLYGMAGVGKTTLLRKIHNSYKVSNIFDVVIWVTVSQDYEISKLQDHIAEAINLDLSSTSNTDTRMMKLSASLKEKKFLLILDDLWSPLNLQEKLGVTFGGEKVSKLVFSTRNRDLALMEADRSLKLEHMSIEEGRELFQRVAFKESNVPEELKKCAIDFADECEGLPLAITVVAATMRGKPRVVDEWNSCLSLMRSAGRSFPDTHPRIDKELYRRLRWSYDHLPNQNLQNCFLYSAKYAEDWKIWVDELVHCWIAEGFIKRTGSYSMDMKIGYDYVRLLIDRGLFQNFNFEKRSKRNASKPVDVWKFRKITVHDVIRDMAIHIGEEEENYLCRTGQGLRDFPQTLTQYCKRISLECNEIKYLPKDFLCAELVSLHLYGNPLISNVPENFLINLTALRVLDLSNISIESVPASLAQLTLLEVLDLNSTRIKELPQDICNLSELRFLNVSYCKNLTSLPETIGKLTQLQHIKLSECNNLVLPAEISQVTSLKRLWWDVGTETKVLKDPRDVIALKGLTNLRELSLFIFLEFEADEFMGSWFEMRHLRLGYNNKVNNTLPRGMQNMKKLESLQLDNYIPVNLPNWLCEFEQLERLELTNCGKELPSLESLPHLKFLKLIQCNDVIDFGIGSSQKPGGFPRLETLVLKFMEKLRSMTCPSGGGVFKEGTLSELRVLKIFGCPLLKKLPIGLCKLPHLEIFCEDSWWEHISWDDSSREDTSNDVL